MANQEHLEILKQGIEVWNQWRRDNPEVKPDFSETNLNKEWLADANLSEANLSSVILAHANLSKANLTYANLSGANLSQAHLSQANLSKANLHRANFSGANLLESYLIETDLSIADLTWATLTRADLRRANLTGTNLFNAHLLAADLSGGSLMGANLSGANLIEANLSETEFSQANLTGATLIEANLSGAHLLKANLSVADLTRANLSKADLSGSDLRRARLIDTKLAKSDLSNCSVYGISAWKLSLEGTTQTNLNISDYSEPPIYVDSIEIAQFIYLLLNHKKLRDVLNAVTEKGVLILGRFGNEGIEMLQAIAAKLRDSGYLPIIFDFEKPEVRNYTETIKTLAGLSRFVIADLSGPSVPQELYATVPHFKIPFVPIIEKGRKQFAMFVDILEYPWVLEPVEFEDKAQLLELLPARVIAPAEDKFKERQKKLDELFK